MRLTIPVAFMVTESFLFGSIAYANGGNHRPSVNT
jgi:hypothetical protein